MNPGFDRIIAADDQTRLGLFTATALRLGTTPQNAEKDFWVCWTLDALFNGLPAAPRLLFKGGTSLSKGFGLISRFSEDIDVTVFRDDIGEAAAIADLAALSGKKREATLDRIKAACTAHVGGPMFGELCRVATETSFCNGLSSGRLTISLNPDDAQSLLVNYPTATDPDPYVIKAVKIESGAKSALDPNCVRTVRPYAEADAPGIDLAVANVTIVDAERTFWDKVIILHGLRRWYDHRQELRGDGQRISRHYYDIHQLMASETGRRALADHTLGGDCVAHAKMFFNRPAFDLDSAKPPTFTLIPERGMYEALRRDYQAMSGMIFGAAPAFGAVIESVVALEAALNANRGQGAS